MEQGRFNLPNGSTIDLKKDNSEDFPGGLAVKNLPAM